MLILHLRAGHVVDFIGLFIKYSCLYNYDNYMKVQKDINKFNNLSYHICTNLFEIVLEKR